MPQVRPELEEREKPHPTTTVGFSSPSPSEHHQNHLRRILPVFTTPATFTVSSFPVSHSNISGIPEPPSSPSSSPIAVGLHCLPPELPLSPLQSTIGPSLVISGNLLQIPASCVSFRQVYEFTGELMKSPAPISSESLSFPAKIPDSDSLSSALLQS